MYKNLKKMWPLSVAFVAATSFVHAASDSAQLRNLENRVNALEQRRSASGMINPPGRPQVRDGVDLFLFGDLLYWNAHENGLPVAVVNHGSAVNLSKSEVKSIHSHWDVGFRVGIGYNLPHDGWDLSLSWLRLRTDGTRSINAHSNDFVWPSRVEPADNFGGVPCAKANSHWRLLLNQLDLDLGREFFVSKYLTLRPHFGLRTDWVHQKWNTSYRNFIGTLPPTKVKVGYEDEWFGMGLEGGLDTQWTLGSGFSLFGNMSGAILYGFHDIEFEDRDSPAQINTNSKGRYADGDSVYRISHPVLDMMAGVRYDHMFYNDRFHLGLQIGWEHHVYFSQNQFPVFTDDISQGTLVSNQGDLTFQGWTFGARFDF
jgi:Legionella pneumophila major outer membrane protein precursor